jgi:hypothetical protein
VILWDISIQDLLQSVRVSQPIFLLAGLALAALAFVLVALRWRVLAGWLGLAISTRLAVRALFIGAFGGQVLPSGLGTDVLRGWLVARHTVAIRRVVASLVADRLVALFAACLVLALSGLGEKRSSLPIPDLLAPAAAIATGAVLIAFVLWCSGSYKLGVRLGVPVPLREIGTMDGVALRAKPILLATAIALAVQAAAVVIAALTARAYAVDASLDLWVSVIPLCVIAGAVPISINGWGVREATMIVLVAPAGIAAADALLVSATLGILNIVASLPGGVLMLNESKTLSEHDSRLQTVEPGRKDR